MQYEIANISDLIGRWLIITAQGSDDEPIACGELIDEKAKFCRKECLDPMDNFNGTRLDSLNITTTGVGSEVHSRQCAERIVRIVPKIAWNHGDHNWKSLNSVFIFFLR